MKEWCQERGIKYVHYPSIKDNVVAMMIRLKKLGIDKNEKECENIYVNNNYTEYMNVLRNSENHMLESVDFTSKTWKVNK